MEINARGVLAGMKLCPADGIGELPRGGTKRPTFPKPSRGIKRENGYTDEFMAERDYLCVELIFFLIFGMRAIRSTRSFPPRVFRTRSRRAHL